MKAKNLSKVLAFLVAAVMIFSALPLMAFAADEATPYTVSFGAPAIPMNVNTKVDLKTLAVEMTDSLKYDDAGTVSGADVTWAAADQAGLIFDATAKTVEVTAVGNYKLTATANGITKNVWVIAKEAAATDFNIVNYDFTKAGSFNASEWQLLQYKSKTLSSGTAKPMDGTYTGFKDTTAKGYLTVGSSGDYTVIFINKSEIFKDFRDYTITYHAIMATGNNMPHNGLGFGARMVLDNDGVLDLDTNSFIGVMSNIGQMRMESHSGSDQWGQFTSNQDQYTEVKAEYYWYQNKPHTILGKFDGEILLFTRDDTVVYDMSAHTNGRNDFKNNKNNAYAIELGYPGIRNHGGEGRIYNFIVKLNSTDMPATMTDEPETPAPEADITIVGEGTAKVDAVVGSENTYTVALAPAEGYKVKLGSVVINGDKIIDTDETGRVYTFATADLDNTTIAVEYIADNGQFNTVMLGATIPTNPEVKGIRFGARTDSIMRAAQGATTGLLNEKIYVGGAEYDVTEIGMILLPTQLLGEADLTVATDKVVRQAVTKIVGLTDDYSDIAITLTNIPDTMAGVQITSRMYVAYTDADGATQYVYSDTIAKSYDDVVAAIAQ